MTITTLLEHPDLWRAGRPGSASRRAAQPSRHTLLDRHLPGGGWPVGAVSELCFGQTGIGELQLLAPTLAALSRQKKQWITWLNPPFLPYPPALCALDIDVGRMLLIRPSPAEAKPTRTPGPDAGPDAGKNVRPDAGTRNARTLQHRQMLWALEQASRSGACSAVLAWLDERQVTVRDIQRLQAAARQGNTLIWLFRPETALQQASLASLRLHLQAVQGSGRRQLQVDITKRHGGWPVGGLVLDLLPDRDSGADRRLVTELLTFWRSERTSEGLFDRARPPATGLSLQGRALH